MSTFSTVDIHHLVVFSNVVLSVVVPYPVLEVSIAPGGIIILRHENQCSIYSISAATLQHVISLSPPCTRVMGAGFVSDGALLLTEDAGRRGSTNLIHYTFNDWNATDITMPQIAKRYVARSFHFSPHILIMLDTQQGVHVTSLQRENFFAGPMYPAGFRLIMEVTQHVEEETDLDYCSTPPMDDTELLRQDINDIFTPKTCMEPCQYGIRVLEECESCPMNFWKAITGDQCVPTVQKRRFQNGAHLLSPAKKSARLENSSGAARSSQFHLPLRVANGDMFKKLDDTRQVKHVKRRNICNLFLCVICRWVNESGKRVMLIVRYVLM